MKVYHKLEHMSPYSLKIIQFILFIITIQLFFFFNRSFVVIFIIIILNLVLIVIYKIRTFTLFCQHTFIRIGFILPAGDGSIAFEAILKKSIAPQKISQPVSSSLHPMIRCICSPFVFYLQMAAHLRVILIRNHFIETMHSFGRRMLTKFSFIFMCIMRNLEMNRIRRRY
jgi:hypothetical protein